MSQDGEITRADDVHVCNPHVPTPAPPAVVGIEMILGDLMRRVSTLDALVHETERRGTAEGVQQKAVIAELRALVDKQGSRISGLAAENEALRAQVQSHRDIYNKHEHVPHGGHGNRKAHLSGGPPQTQYAMQ
ncbi:hypothetical protein KIPB_013163 [Kipferlia bialata]|uniref:Uncharacterized protein n=1 Tax=Kipferlia bialata TaxID=797122 RepID=A0A9K3D9Y9_9EUKA|nr:hypothetical protein KIPB_013163 [Kipferlia bialata]|eukprot:g13163.t1